jgi:hypothetical protein
VARSGDRRAISEVVVIWLWVLLSAGVLVLAGLSIGATILRRRSDELRRGFGPEYARAIIRAEDPEAAEAELRERRRRHEELELHPLERTEREHLMDAGEEAERELADEPLRAITKAERLIVKVMRDRGYPVEEFDDRAAIVSVDHPVVVERYRRARAIAVANLDGSPDVDNLRQAMDDYRALFVQLVEDEDENEAEDEDARVS